jgi:phage replication-related protein YjqB (UPF0714/DUF867 family)
MNERRFRGSTALLAAVAAASTGCGGAAGRDTYANYADLAAHEREGSDYTITVNDRHAPVSVFAIHGGSIDTGTDRIAQAVAGGDWNSYVFIGPSYRFHVTSAHYDEPRLLSLVRASERCVSIHGHRSQTPRICVGGADEALRAQVARSLAASGLPFQILTHCEGLDGVAPSNPVNLCRGPGVQLELSGAARSELFADPALMAHTAKAIRASIGAR